MKNTRVARRYAVALMTAAEESRSIDSVAGDLQWVGKLLKESRGLVLFLISPVIPARKKMIAFRELLENKVGKEVLTFFLLLARKGREDVIPDIVGQFGALLDERQGIVDARVKSAVPIEKEQEQLLKKRLETYTSKKVRMEFGIDKSLRGGLVIQIGDTVLDGSVRHQLELLKDRFVAGGTLS